MLTIRNYNVHAHKKQLLKNINVTLFPGEVTIILGANGAGKSTFINSLAGGEANISNQLNTTGHIYFQDKDIHQWPRKELAKQRAIMPQQVQLNFPFKVHEVVMMGRSPHGIGKGSRKIAEEALQLLEIHQLRNRYYPTLSGGEQQRTQLARVLTQIWPSDSDTNNKYLLLDECTSALDPAHQHLVLEVIKSFTNKHLISCAITHDLHLAAQYGDRILLFKDGEIIADGPPAEVLNRKNLTDTYQLNTKIIKHPEVLHPLIISLGRNKQPLETASK